MLYFTGEKDLQIILWKDPDDLYKTEEIICTQFRDGNPFCFSGCGMNKIALPFFI